jgi:hypothetical protein
MPRWKPGFPVGGMMGAMSTTPVGSTSDDIPKPPKLHKAHQDILDMYANARAELEAAKEELDKASERHRKAIDAHDAARKTMLEWVQDDGWRSLVRLRP